MLNLVHHLAKMAKLAAAAVKIVLEIYTTSGNESEVLHFPPKSGGAKYVNHEIGYIALAAPCALKINGKSELK